MGSAWVDASFNAIQSCTCYTLTRTVFVYLHTKLKEIVFTVQRNNMYSCKTVPFARQILLTHSRPVQ